MITIPIFHQEIDDGIAEKIVADTSIAYLTPVVKFEPGDDLRKSLASSLSVASPSDPDLYYVKSVLVTSSWNRNDDVFDKSEVWAARHTPEDKPTNIEHDESQVVGHMTECWAVDADFNVLDDNLPVDRIPDPIHLINGSVIYLRYSDPELQSRANTLISEIESKQKFVSMECLFRNFDYAILDQDIVSKGSYEVQPRTADSAYLTKYLRAYGGPGEYEGKKIGRILRNILFCGKGFVNSPANPESVILSKCTCQSSMSVIDGGKWVVSFPATYNTSTISEDGVLSCVVTSVDSNCNTDNQRSNSMADDNKVQDQVKDLKAEIATLQKQIADANVDNLKKSIADLTAEVDRLKAEVADKEKAIDGLNDLVETSKSKIEELSQSNEKIQSALDEAVDRELIAKRMNILIAGGMDQETAQINVDKFKDLADEQFSIVADALIVAIPTPNDLKVADVQETEETEATEEEEEEENVENTEADLDEVEVEDEPALAAESDEVVQQMDEIRRGLQDFVRGRLGLETEEVNEDED